LRRGPSVYGRGFSDRGSVDLDSVDLIIVGRLV